MEKDTIGTLYQILKKYPAFRINGNLCSPSESSLKDYVSKGGHYIRVLSDGIPDVDVHQLIEDEQRNRYREEKLKYLATIARELIRLNDKKELNEFVTGLSGSVPEKKSLD